MRSHLSGFLSDEVGSTAIEYALIAFIVGAGIVGALMLLATTLDGGFASILDGII